MAARYAVQHQNTPDLPSPPALCSNILELNNEKQIRCPRPEITIEGIGGGVGESAAGSSTSTEQSRGAPNQGVTLRHLRVHEKGFVEGVEYAQEPRQQALLLALMDDLLNHEMYEEALKTACASQGQRFKSSKVFAHIPMVYTTFVRDLSLDGRYQLRIPQQDRSWLH